MTFPDRKPLLLICLKYSFQYFITFFFLSLIVSSLFTAPTAAAFDQPLEGPGSAEYFYETVITNLNPIAIDL